jgi:hypothetical protein
VLLAAAPQENTAVIHSGDCTAFGQQASQARQICMSASRHRIYLAVGIFYDSARLRAASQSLNAWGFSGNDLWQAVLREPPTGAQAPGKDGELVLTELPVEAVEHEPFALGDRRHLPDVVLQSIAGGSLGAEIQQHVKQGATVLVARTEGSDLHDQCVKVLLRNSQHTVHSLEINSPPDAGNV